MWAELQFLGYWGVLVLSGLGQIGADSEMDDETRETYKMLSEKINFTIATNDGRVYGRLFKGENGDWYQSWGNIPYAEPPTNDLRFKKPEPVDPWRDVKDLSFSLSLQSLVQRCVQLVRWGDFVGNDRIDGDEDCLKLSVIRPASLDFENRRWNREDVLHYQPNAHVLVFLHPGTFMYDIPINIYKAAEQLCCNYMIFVFVRYRLGPLGFANLGYSANDVMTPNLGLWDQRAALIWVQNNIRYFGGDLTLVTLAGAGAGGASVNYHLMSRWSKGLFTKAISIGGSALCPWAFAEESIPATRKLAKALNCDMTNTITIADCLKKMPVYNLLTQSEKLYVFQNIPISPMGPVVDNEFIDAEPTTLMRGGQVKNIPWLISYSHDYSLYPNYDYILHLYKVGQSDAWDHLAPHILGLQNLVSRELMRNVTNLVKYHYIRPNRHYSDNDAKHRFATMISDRQYTYGIVEAARLHSVALNRTRRSLSRAFLYAYDFYLGLRYGDFLTTGLAEYASRHRSEIELIANASRTDHEAVETDTSKAERIYNEKVRSLLVEYWMTFMRDGSPHRSEPPKNQIFMKDTTMNSKVTNDVHYQLIKGPPLSYYEDTSTNIGEANLWRALPIQDYQELEDNVEKFNENLDF